MTSQRAIRRLAWVILGVAALLSLCGLALLAHVPAPAIERTGGSLPLQAMFVVVMLETRLVQVNCSVTVEPE